MVPVYGAILLFCTKVDVLWKQKWIKSSGSTLSHLRRATLDNNTSEQNWFRESPKKYDLGGSLNYLKKYLTWLPGKILWFMRWKFFQMILINEQKARKIECCMIIPDGEWADIKQINMSVIGKHLRCLRHIISVFTQNILNTV